jgi:hypothetical protein
MYVVSAFRRTYLIEGGRGFQPSRVARLKGSRSSRVTVRLKPDTTYFSA